VTSPSALEGERKQATVLFCDLANATALAERLGPEAMPEHGMGLYLVRQIADRVSFNVARERGTQWTLVKYRQGREPDRDKIPDRPDRSA
jgi:hypothetical protein